MAFDKNTAWVIDAKRTESFPPFVFYQYDSERHVILDNVIVSKDPPGYIIGVIHDDGTEAADEFYSLYESILREYFGEAFMDLGV